MIASPLMGYVINIDSQLCDYTNCAVTNNWHDTLIAKLICMICADLLAAGLCANLLVFPVLNCFLAYSADGHFSTTLLPAA
ncbi:hypothetical protein K439DRAFT_1641462 [Ramaria rubella]|nr:hypothetical protein K439DRAFT_1641462 [Ramaria rubella]